MCSIVFVCACVFGVIGVGTNHEDRIDTLEGTVEVALNVDVEKIGDALTCTGADTTGVQIHFGDSAENCVAILESLNDRERAAYGEVAGVSVAYSLREMRKLEPLKEKAETDRDTQAFAWAKDVVKPANPMLGMFKNWAQ